MRLGYTYRDKITQFRGVAIGHCQYLTGCNQTLLQPASAGNDNNQRAESHWFDDQRLELIPGISPVVLDNGATPGCDKPAPKI